MGSPWYEMGRDTNDEGPRHEVDITRPFYMGKYEVKIGEFRRFVKETGYKTEAETKRGAGVLQGIKWVGQAGIYWDNPGFSQTDLHPVTCVSWNDAMKFAGWLSKKTGHKYRLPTEAEWEYACRAGTQTARYWGKGENEACRYANIADRAIKQISPDFKIHECEDGYANTAPVGCFRPNAFGLYDMLGNLWEWCADWYDKDYYKKSSTKDPAGPEGGSNRVFRGGSWSSPPDFARCAKRIGQPPSGRSTNISLRLVRTIE